MIMNMYAVIHKSYVTLVRYSKLTLTQTMFLFSGYYYMISLAALVTSINILKWIEASISHAQIKSKSCD